MKVQRGSVSEYGPKCHAGHGPEMCRRDGHTLVKIRASMYRAGILCAEDVKSDHYRLPSPWWW
ncbi:hypothetical protein E2C01_074162 [Portunus trituberculatus]|uniref:Uncharacterized protein n=1 Tax=Portunus trituberculatus TaxID=210409 RepID=A0A5B7ICI6_PORTR|nr:hypothetical protein [Portunus trituberculatus]